MLWSRISRSAKKVERAGSGPGEHLAEDRGGALHLLHAADRNPAVLLELGELPADHHAPGQAGVLELLRVAPDVDHQEVGFRWLHLVTEAFEEAPSEGAGLPALAQLLLDMGWGAHRGHRTGRRGEVDTVADPPGPHRGDGVGLGDGIADPESRQAVDLGEGAG